MAKRVQNKFTNNFVTHAWPFETDRVSQTLRLPLGYCAAKFPGSVPQYSLAYNKEKPLPINLRGEQESFIGRFIEAVNRKTSFGWELEPGFGKTVLVLAVIARCDLNAIIVVHRKCLKTQWESEIKKFGSLRAQVIMSADLKAPENTDLLVIDEAHLLVTRSVIPNLAKWQPSILLGLSGTFYRYGGDPSLEWFFHNRMKLGKDEEALNCLRKTGKLYVEICQTSIVPAYKTTSRGKFDWNSILQSLAENEKRNNMIVNKALETSQATVLILVKFIKHGELLFRKITSKTTRKCCLCIGSAQIDESADIFISTFKKMGTGVSIEKLNKLIVAADVENYAIQYFGRVMRNGGNDANIVDFVDDFSSLRKHSATRLGVYTRLNAVVTKSCL